MTSAWYRSDHVFTHCISQCPMCVMEYLLCEYFGVKWCVIHNFNCIYHFVSTYCFPVTWTLHNIYIYQIREVGSLLENRHNKIFVKAWYWNLLNCTVSKLIYGIYWASAQWLKHGVQQLFWWLEVGIKICLLVPSVNWHNCNSNIITTSLLFKLLW